MVHLEDGPHIVGLVDAYCCGDMGCQSFQFSGFGEKREGEKERTGGIHTLQKQDQHNEPLVVWDDSVVQVQCDMLQVCVKDDYFGEVAVEVGEVLWGRGLVWKREREELVSGKEAEKGESTCGGFPDLILS